MEYGRVPRQYLKADCLAPEADYATKNLKCTVRKATADDIAKIEAEIAAKVARTGLTCSITAEMGLDRKAEKKPEIPFKEIPNKAKSEWLSQRQYNPVKLQAPNMEVS